MYKSEIGEGSEGKPKEKRINLDTEIPDFLELPEFKWSTRKTNKKTTRIARALMKAYESEGIKTLQDLKKEVEETGWIMSNNYRLGRFDGLGIQSAKYLKRIFRRYGIEPFGPMFGPY